jgi:uncharacterized protein YjiS (DUF1127 family)
MSSQIRSRSEASPLVRSVRSSAPAASWWARLCSVAGWAGRRAVQYWRYRNALHQLAHLGDRALDDIGLIETPWQSGVVDEAKRQDPRSLSTIPAPWTARDFLQAEHRARQTAAVRAKVRGASLGDLAETSETRRRLARQRGRA